MKSLYLNKRLFIVLTILVFLFLTAHFYPSILFVVQFLFFILVILVVLDILLLFRKKGIKAKRLTTEKLSNGDPNHITLFIENTYPFRAKTQVIDELPFQFQVRDSDYTLTLVAGASKKTQYIVNPTERGEYHFGHINVYAASPLGLVLRRFQLGEPQVLPVYPSYLQMRKYELMAFTHQPNAMGSKKVRRLGHSTEFEQIKQYVSDDNFRHINWLATARKNQLMVNQYQDEKLQKIYIVIDKGRLMEMPFEGMSLLDYAINAALAIANIAIKKGDKAGLITFSNQIETTLPTSRSGTQMQRIQELLYNQQSNFLESNFEHLNLLLLTRFSQRSLVLLFSNFESLTGMKRQLKYLRKIAKQHVLLVIFFENTELKILNRSNANNLSQTYDKIIAEKFEYEKRLIIKELNRYGIQALISSPKKLTINTINKYIEIKMRGLI